MSDKKLDRPNLYAVWHPNNDIRLSSSSGGAFTILAEAVIKRGGVVFGAAWNQDCDVVMTAVETVKQLSLLRESKYVAALADNVYEKVRLLLESGREVLFSGTPCQVAGLYSFLRGKNYNNLITVDFICHGTPDRRVWRKYLSYLEAKYQDKVCDIHFRDKRWGVECNLLLKINLKQRKLEKIISQKENSYYCGFNRRITLRRCCLSCTFNGLPRQADFSLADFRGLGDRVAFSYERDKIKGFTAVMVNTSHALRLMKEIDMSTWIERPFEELYNNQSALQGVKEEISDDYERFWQDFQTSSWEELEKKYCTPSFRYCLQILVRRILRPSLFMRLGLIYKFIRGKRTTSLFPGGGAA